TRPQTFGRTAMILTGEFLAYSTEFILKIIAKTGIHLEPVIGIGSGAGGGVRGLITREKRGPSRPDLFRARKGESEKAILPIRGGISVSRAVETDHLGEVDLSELHRIDDLNPEEGRIEFGSFGFRHFDSRDVSRIPALPIRAVLGRRLEGHDMSG